MSSLYTACVSFVHFARGLSLHPVVTDAFVLAVCVRDSATPCVQTKHLARPAMSACVKCIFKNLNMASVLSAHRVLFLVTGALDALMFVITRLQSNEQCMSLAVEVMLAVQQPAQWQPAQLMELIVSGTFDKSVKAMHDH